VERFPGRATLLAVQLSTGRRNQIRLHAMLARHPLVGEKLYREGNAGVVEFGRYALHAQVLGFTHPTTGEARRFEAPLPDDLRILLDGLRPSS
jgi:23S rRNA pseudouridine1911/1915/1917 synthase